MSKLRLLRTNKLTTTISPKSSDKSTSRILIAMVMMTLLLATSASMVIAPAQATTLPQRDLPITIPEPPNDDNDGRLAGTVLDCVRDEEFPAVLDCIRAVFEDPDVDPSDPCRIEPEFPC